MSSWFLKTFLRFICCYENKITDFNNINDSTCNNNNNNDDDDDDDNNNE